MSRQLKLLEYRRYELMIQAERERKKFADHFEPWEKPLSWADKGVDAFHFLKVIQYCGPVHLQRWHITNLG